MLERVGTSGVSEDPARHTASWKVPGTWPDLYSRDADFRDTMLKFNHNSGPRKDDRHLSESLISTCCIRIKSIRECTSPVSADCNLARVESLCSSLDLADTVIPISVRTGLGM